MKYRGVEILTGAFVLLGLALVLAGIFLIRGVGLGGLDEYFVRYRNVAGIEEGTLVKYAGMQVGRVTRIAVDEGDASRVRVDIEIVEGTPVTDRIEAKITRSDILGDPYVDLRIASEREGTAAAISPMGSTIAPGSEIAAGEPFDLQRTLDAAQSAITSLDQLATLVKGQVQDVIQAVSRVLESTERLLAPENRARIESAIEDLSATTQRVRLLVDENRASLDRIIENADATTRSMRSVASEVDVAIDELLPTLRDIAHDTKLAVGDVRNLVGAADSTLGAVDVQQLNDLLGSLESTARNLDSMSRTLKERPYLIVRAPKPGRPRLPDSAAADGAATTEVKP